MTLLFVDGFSHYATEDLSKKYSLTQGSTVISSSEGRRGSGCLKNASGTGNGQGYVAKSFASLFATGGIGFAFYIDDAPVVAADGQFLDIRGGGSTHLILGVNTSGGLTVYRGTTSTVLVSSSNGIITYGAWQHIELKATINDTTGAVEVRLNGVAVITLSSVDTRNAGSAGIDRFSIGQIDPIGSHVRFCDLAIWNSSGSSNNNFLGDCRVDTIFPTSDGTYTAFTPSTGSSHYALVDEASVNTSDYNDGASSGDRDSYGMGNLTALTSSTVYGVQVAAAVQKDDAGARSAGTMVRSGSTNSDGAGAALSTSQVFICEIYEQDPNATAAWTESTVNAMEAGVKVTA